MVTQILLTRILIDGGILTAVVSTVLVLMLYFKPRMALSDYPEDVKAAIPPRTKEELRAGIVLSIPLLILFIAYPLYSVWRVKFIIGDELTYWMAFAIIFGEYFIVSMFDLIVLDLFMFYTWTPKFLVLPGTEGFAGYKDYRPHVKAQLTVGNLMLGIFSALLALVPTYLW
jgi:hypothetical protein